MTRAAAWSTPQALVDQCPTARPIANGRVIFNICGNNYRLIVGLNYDRGIVFIKWFGTHADYDDVDATTVEDH